MVIILHFDFIQMFGKRETRLCKSGLLAYTITLILKN